MAANDLKQLLLETFTSHREVKHFTQLLDFRAEVRVGQMRENVDSEIIVELNVQVVEGDV